MSKSKPTGRELVDLYIQQLPENTRPAVAYLRQLVLSVDKEITEHIKWNAPAFYYAGEMKAFDPKTYKRDILVLNLRNGRIMCVLPTGAVIKQNTSILEGDYPDGRRMIYFKDQDDIRAKAQELKAALAEWLSLIQK